MTRKFFSINRYVIGSFLTASLAASLVTGCKKNHDEPDTRSAAFHISEAEKLAIPAAVDLPANTPGGNTRVATFYAVGVQKYKSQQKADNPGVFEWVFVSPSADLYDATNNKVGTHSAGPSWQLTGGADSLTGQAFSPPRSASSTDAGSIDWLLLMPKIGKTPTGIFANVSYIQRLVTIGGKAPTTAPAEDGLAIDVPYTAIYRFTKIN